MYYKMDKIQKKHLLQFAENDIDIYVIEYKNKFIGELSAIYSNHSLPTETIPNVRVYFSAFRLEKKYQNKGLGQELMRYAINDLKNQGYTQFTIGVEENNEIAKHIYSKFGFTEAIDHGYGNGTDSEGYTLYLKK